MFYLKQGIEHFYEKYPFLVLNFHERDQEAQIPPVEEQKKNDQPILTPFQSKLFYAFSRFPTEMVEGKLFLVSN